MPCVTPTPQQCSVSRSLSGHRRGREEWHLVHGARLASLGLGMQGGWPECDLRGALALCCPEGRAAAPSPPA